MDKSTCCADSTPGFASTAQEAEPQTGLQTLCSCLQHETKCFIRTFVFCFRSLQVCQFLLLSRNIHYQPWKFSKPTYVLGSDENMQGLSTAYIHNDILIDTDEVITGVCSYADWHCTAQSWLLSTEHHHCSLHSVAVWYGLRRDNDLIM